MSARVGQDVRNNELFFFYQTIQCFLSAKNKLLRTKVKTQLRDYLIMKNQLYMILSSPKLWSEFFLPPHEGTITRFTTELI